MIPTDGRHARRRPRGPLALGAGIVAVLLVAGIMVYASVRAKSRSDFKGTDVATTVPTEPAPQLEQPPALEAWPRWGITHTQFSADNEPGPVQDEARDLLGRVPMLQNQHIMGWGVGNPEPSPGQFNLRDLNRRLEFMSSSRATPVITLCCAPDWMKGGQAGRTDWSKNPTVAPKPEHFADYAKLAARIAKQYPTVRHYMVWNELKGFWDPSTNRWDAQGYTDMYNQVYTALKKVNPEIQVGGPYVSLESYVNGNPSELTGPWGTVDQRALEAIKYWIEHKKGADFIVIDSASMTKDKGNVPDDFGAQAKFGAITKWLRQQSGDMPVWWAEWYNEPENSGWSEEKRTAVQATTMMEFARSGVTTALYWNPQLNDAGDCPGCLWAPKVGGELPMAGLLSGFTKWFPAGVRLVDVPSSDDRVRVLAQDSQVVMVNTSDRPVTATVDGRQVSLAPYEIKWAGRGA
ncbi:GH39 family glycosyl hydrolase [Nonomuraea jiangxiensis]|uniref:Glycosyl hydrolases family 39 n=1 Tax=Nonomuraea jiangxiensis TaxID=633440 RepID=A0A1G9A9M2_9ACTN|nr:xylan 1,4-beta-xylosidase [Nonomuraea jiangxiensis]SDK23963.1 Glycosyl hydrolases family 39 [Nonomuraea jiangxiensis]